MKSRRAFLGNLLKLSSIGIMGAIFYPVLIYLKPHKGESTASSAIKIKNPEEIEPGSSRILRFGTKPVLLIRTPEGEFRAFSAACTHLECTVQYRKEMGAIWCACHNGKFDLNGNNISGPPPRPLERYETKISGNELIVRRMT